MKHPAGVRMLLVFFFFSLVIPSLIAKGSSEDNDDIVALVNGTYISKSFLDREILRAEREYAQQGMVITNTEKQKIRTEALDRLINFELLYQESQKQGYSVEEPLVDQEVDALKGRFPNQQEYENALTDLNYTETELMVELEHNLAIQNFVTSEIRETVSISEQESLQYYEEHPELFVQHEQVRARHILITVDEQAGEEDKKIALSKIEEIQRQLQKGADFAQLAKEHSQGPSGENGGDLGFFERGQMVKPFEDAAFALGINELSSIVLTRFGYHLIQVTGRKEEKPLLFAEVKIQIDDHLRQNQIVTEINDLLRTLRSNARIEMY